jgi:acyl dehydratase
MAIPEKVAELIGKPLGEPQVFEVERGAIRRFANAVDDPNPLYHDVEYAKNSKYGEMIAPLGFHGWPMKGGLMEMMGSIIGPIMNAGYPVILDAGLEFESFVPIRAGDILSSYAKITDIAEKTTKSGKGMLILTTEMNFLNQNGDRALVERSSIICREL